MENHYFIYLWCTTSLIWNGRENFIKTFWKYKIWNFLLLKHPKETLPCYSRRPWNLLAKYCELIPVGKSVISTLTAHLSGVTFSTNRQNTLKLFWKPTQDTKILGERDQTMPTFQQFYSVCLLRMSLFCCCPHTGRAEAWEGSETIHIMGNIKRRKKEHLFAMETLEVRPLLKDDVHRSLFIYRKIIMIFN